jgi:hypothetical protein
MTEIRTRRRNVLLLLGAVTAITVALTAVNSSGKSTAPAEKDYEVLLLCSSCGHLEKRPAREVFFALDVARRAAAPTVLKPGREDPPLTPGLECSRCHKRAAFPRPLQCPRCKHYYHPLPTPTGVIDIVCRHCNYPLPPDAPEG